MKVTVKRTDIEEGRANANYHCGCPIHRALARKLKVPTFDDQSSNVLRVPSRNYATLGKIKIPLPQSAVEFQNRLIADQDARVRPFSFETELIAPK